jgi:hypothetical protein
MASNYGAAGDGEGRALLTATTKTTHDMLKSSYSITQFLVSFVLTYVVNALLGYYGCPTEGRIVLDSAWTSVSMNVWVSCLIAGWVQVSLLPCNVIHFL